MSDELATPEELARIFHDVYELLAPQFGYTTRPETRTFDPESANGRLMIAVCATVRGALRVSPPADESVQMDARRYRWLRDKSIHDVCHAPTVTSESGYGIKVRWQGFGERNKPSVFLYDANLDSAVDAAMAKGD